MEFDYDVQFRSGSLNSVADCLSRLPLPGTGMDFAETVESVATILTDNAVPQSDFKAECHFCPLLTKHCALIQKPWPKQNKAVDPDLQAYYLMWWTDNCGLYCQRYLPPRCTKFTAEKTHRHCSWDPSGHCPHKAMSKRTVLVVKNWHTGGNAYQGLYYM